MWALTAAEMASCIWLKPVRLVQIEFQEWTRWTLATFDKDAPKVRRE